MRKRVRLSATEVGLLQFIGRGQGGAYDAGKTVDKSPARDRLKRLRLIESRAHSVWGQLGYMAGKTRWYLTDQGRKVVEVEAQSAVCDL